MRLLLRGSIPAVMLALTAIWAMPHVASADGFEVNRTYDLKDATPGDGKCETAIGNGICTLRAAIEESNENGRWNNIFLPKGNYRLTRGALPPMTSSMIIQGEGPDASVIWGPCTSNEREKESGHCIPPSR
jgi:hypothetical protein